MSTCLICCEDDVAYEGWWDCEHSACWHCSLRLLASTKALECMMCKQPSKVLRIKAARGGKAAGEHAAEGWDERVVCATPAIAAAVAQLKVPVCEKCGVTFPGAPEEYMRHLKKEHGVALCKVCFDGRPQVFVHEHTLYSLPDGLRRHECMDEDHPDDEPNFMGHPACRFCGKRVYDNMALLNHVSEDHFSCSICDAETQDSHTTVYRDAVKLAEHLKAHHHYCTDCHDQHIGKGGSKNVMNVNPMQFTFATELDLGIHRAKMHAQKGKKTQGLLLDVASGPSQVQQQQAAAHTAPSAEEEVRGVRAYAIVFCHGGAKAERVPLIDSKESRRGNGSTANSTAAAAEAAAALLSATPSPVNSRPASPAHAKVAPAPKQPQPAGVKSSDAPVVAGGRGRGRGRGGKVSAGYSALAVDDEPAAPVIRQKFAVQFSAENGMSFGFNPATADGGGIVCVVGGVAGEHIVRRINYEGEGSLKFPDLRKRLKLPADSDIRMIVLDELGALATRCGVQHNIPRMVPQGVPAPAPTPAPAAPAKVQMTPVAAAGTQEKLPPGRGGRGAGRGRGGGAAPVPWPAAAAVPPTTEKPSPPAAAATPVRSKSKTTQYAPLTDEIQGELETLTAIFGDDAIEAHDADTGSFGPLKDGAETSTKYRYRVEGEVHGKPCALFMEFHYPAAYPDLPPVVDFATDTTCGLASSYAVLPRHMVNGLTQEVLGDYEAGEPVVYNCVEWARENFEERLKILVGDAVPAGDTPAANGGGGRAAYEPAQVDLQGLEVIEGPAITDRKSKFVAHAARITSHDEAMRVVRYLRSIKRIAVAAHPTIWAYRVSDGTRIREERDDDGETGAADKLLFFLQRANVTNYVVVVTRWYGGIHLGSDRFKHITTVAKELLQQMKVVKEGKK